MKGTVRRAVTAAAAVVLVLGACDGDSDETTVSTEVSVEETDSATDSTVTEATEAAATTAGTDADEGVAGPETTDAVDVSDGSDEDADDVAAASAGASPTTVVESELAAQMEGDHEAVAALWANDAVAVQPDGTEIGFYEEVPFPIDDFDGDGVVTIMDDHLATSAITPAMGKTIAAECTETSDTVVECSETTSNAFSEAAAVDPLVIALRLTVEDGLIVRQEFFGPVGDPTAFETATMSGFDDYGLWVAETSPGDHAVMFDDSGMTMTMEAVELHNQMLPIYVEEMLG